MYHNFYIHSFVIGYPGCFHVLVIVRNAATRTLGYMYLTQGAQPSAMWLPRGVGWGERWEGGLRGRGLCIPVTDSCWSMAETSTIL